MERTAAPVYTAAPAVHEDLAARIARIVREDGSKEPIPGLFLHRTSRPNEPVHGVYTPSLCLIAQGSKEISLGEHSYRYGPSRYLLVAVELPYAGRVLEASPDRPYLSLRLTLDPAVVGSVMLEAGLSAPRGGVEMKGLMISALDADLRDAALRLVRLADSPVEARVLAPLVRREIIFRLLLGEQGHLLRHFALLGGTGHPIARAIERLRARYDQPLRIDTLAREVGMSTSGFHAHFKAITERSPLQFQKELRLQEARRLMLGEHLDAAAAGVRVGYHDASHFSRDYRKQFGEAPVRDVVRLRAGLGGTVHDARE